MSQAVLPRTLWYENLDKKIEMQQEALAQLARPLVILGEAGMGKSHLLQWLSNTYGYAFCTARQLINRPDPRSLLGTSRVLVIDGLDEVSAAREGDAIDQVIRRLAELNYPRFVLACRSADWRSATGLEAILEQYVERPLELHLEPLSGIEVSIFLEQVLGHEDTVKTVTHFDDLGLRGLLGNPQTLELLIPVVARGTLPKTRSELFELATEQLILEHKESKAYLQLPLETALTAAGAAFAALLLTGNDVISRSTRLYLQDGELSLAELRGMPGGEHIPTVLGSRLFRAAGPDRFGYWHRRIAEYLGARYLAQQADTPRKRRRMLAIFQNQGFIPASLRGIHAWLTQDPVLASAVIVADPMGLIEYGDPDTLPHEQTRALLGAMKRVADGNPDFRSWRTLAMRSLAHPYLIDEVRQLIVAKDESFGLRLFVLDSLNETPLAKILQAELLALIHNPKENFTLRRSAMQALRGVISETIWVKVATTMRDHGDEYSVRLALDLIHVSGYFSFDDAFIVNLIELAITHDPRTVWRFSELKEWLPDIRLDSFLHHFSARVAIARTFLDDRARSELTNVAYRLIVRRVKAGPVDPKSLWCWLSPFESRDCFDNKAIIDLRDYLQAHKELRHNIQRLVLLEQSDDRSLEHRYDRLHRCSSGFSCSDADAIVLLANLDARQHDDERWKDIVQLVDHDKETGLQVRTAAIPFVRQRHDMLEWMESLTRPSIPAWKIKLDAQRLRRAERHAEHRRVFTARKHLMQQGDYDSLLAPAQAYLKHFDDIGDGVAAHERVAQWLGADLARAAHIGFEAFLQKTPVFPRSEDIAHSYANDKEYRAGYIIVAAVAERLRNGVGLSDLHNERLMAALFVLMSTKVGEHAGLTDLEILLKTELKTRGVWSVAVRQLIEPQLEAARIHVNGLYELMHGDAARELATTLAIEWLSQFHNLPDDCEDMLVDRLLNAGRTAELQTLLHSREFARDSQRRRWDAISLLIDFEQTKARLSSSSVAPELLFDIRYRHAGGRSGSVSSRLSGWSPVQLEWLISTFRVLWSFARSPTSGIVSRNNAQEAGEYLDGLIRSLGNDASTEATQALTRLRNAPQDSYTGLLRTVGVEQARVRAESAYLRPKLETIVAISSDRHPASPKDLQSWILEELAVVQSKIRSDDAESWRGFRDDQGTPYPEERCRDHLLGLLRQGASGVSYEPEGHVASDKEVDIACSVGPLRLPIEIKGQWHRQLWNGADSQLDRLYTPDWRAGGHGVYLVLWFGENVPVNKRPSNPRNEYHRPATPQALQEMLTSCSRAGQEGRVAIVVLDLVRS